MGMHSKTRIRLAGWAFVVLAGASACGTAFAQAAAPITVDFVSLPITWPRMAPAIAPPITFFLSLDEAPEIGRKRVVLGIERRQIGTERDAGSARERRVIDHELGLLLVCQRQGVGRIRRPWRRCAKRR